MGQVAEAAPAGVNVTVTVAAPAQPKPISPYIYGSNQEIGIPNDLTFLRQGGNRMTAYNWENNASNAGNDWHHQSDDYLGGGDTPGEVVRKFVQPVLARGQTAIVTIPMAGFVAADKGPDGDVNKTPDYLNKRFRKSVAAKSKVSDKPFAYPPDLSDEYVFQDEMIHWLEGTFPATTRKGQIWYSLDNEPDIWDGTHARIRQQKLTYKELIDRTIEYSSAIKAEVPNATVLGLVSYGYGGFSTLNGAADGKGRYFVDVFLTEMAKAEKSAGKRLVDVLDLHWYPETKGGGKRITEEKVLTPALVTARVQAPRHLYDPNFREDSWIDKDALRGPIYLLPTIQEKIAKNYPGTKLSFTEYNYGGCNDMSGAIAEADALGAFGHYGVFAAALWPLDEGSAFTAAAFLAYRNYDGKGAKFGDQSLETTSSDIASVSAWASTDSTGKLTMVLINRSLSEAKVALTGQPLAGHGSAELFRLMGTTPKLVPAGTADTTQPLTLPAMSVTVLAAK